MVIWISWLAKIVFGFWSYNGMGIHLYCNLCGVYQNEHPMHCFDVVTNHCLELKGGSEEFHHTLLPSSCPSLYKIQSFIYIICLCHYVVIYEGSLSCDYQLLRKRGSGDVFQLLLMDPRNFPRWQKRSGWWGKGMKRQIVVNEDEWLRDWVAQDFDTKAPLLLLRSWAALSFKVSLSVFF